MSSAELRLSKRASTAGSYIARSFFRTLMSFLVIDAVVMLCFDGALWQWLVLSGNVVITADAHDTAALTFGFDEAAAAIKAAGFTALTVLTVNGFEQQEL